MRILALLTLLLLPLSAVPAGRASASHIVLSGRITARDGAYVEVPFTMPPGVARIWVRFSHTGNEERAVLDLGIADPVRFRGWSGGDKQEFTIATSDATPSYLPGPLPAGRWKLLIGVANLRPQHQARYRAEITLEPASTPHIDALTDSPLKQQRGWYRGDLHMHTAHSDGSCTSQNGTSVPCPVFVTVQSAAQRGLDFIAITDHNTTSHYDAMRELQPYFDRLLLIPGRELTTYRGHANMFGTTQFVEFRAGVAGYPDASAMFAAAHSLGAIVSINHPIAPDDERCMGCGWLDELAVHTADAVEVANGSNRAGYAASIAFWEARLRAGDRPTAIGGSDTHRPERGTIGHPATVVYASDLSVPAILDGIRSGHVFLDLTDEGRSLLEMQGQLGTRTFMMGDEVDVPSGQTISLDTHLQAAPGATLRLLLDGREDSALPPATVSTNDQHLPLSWQSDGKRHWIRAEVRRGDQLQLFGNPLYLNWNVSSARSTKP